MRHINYLTRKGLASLLLGVTVISSGLTAGNMIYNTPVVSYAAEMNNSAEDFIKTVSPGTETTEAEKIAAYIKGLNYNNDTVIAKDTTGSAHIDKKADGKLNPDNSFTIVRKELKKLENSNVDLGTLNANLQDIFPGALLIGNSNLANGKPTPLVTKDRSPITITVNLNGAGNDATRVVENPDYGSVKAAVDDIVKIWGDKGYKTTAQIKQKEVMVHSANQLEAELGVKGVGDKLGVDFKAIEKGEKQVMIMEYQQVYFDVVVKKTGDVFGNNTTLDEIKNQVNDENPPVIVSNVSYGRTVYVMLETSSTELEVKDAFNAVIKGIDISQNATYKSIVEKSSFTAYVLGGTAGTGTGIATTKNFDDIRKILNEEAEFGGPDKAAAYPISYSTAFLRDNAQASVNSTTEYIETTAEKLDNTTIKLHHRGAYVIKKWYIDAQEITGFDDDGNMILGDYKRFYSDTSVAVGKDVERHIPGNYTNYKFGFDISWGSDWPFDGIVSTKNAKNIDIKVTGTTYGANYRIDCDGVVTEG